MSPGIEVADRARRIAFTFDAVLGYHGGGSPGGAAIAFKLLERALPLLDPGGPCERREIAVETAFGGPGARDCVELVTRAVSDGRYRVDQALARPDLGRALERFVFRLSYRDRAVTLTLRPGFVTDELIELARTEPRSPEQERRLDDLKRELAERVMARRADELFDVDEHARATLGAIDGFRYSTVTVGPTRYDAGVAGAGPAVLLLHGFPQTHYCWHRVAPELTGGNTVVVCDLKGYAGSPSEPGGPLGEGYGKRDMAAELVELMRRLGHERFSVAGHDRGGRVAYRMALDHPDAVERLAVLNIVPTVEQFARMAAAAALEYWPWFFLAQPPPFAERIVGASAEHVVRHILETWTAQPGAIAPDAVERYVRAFMPEAIGAICAEFRAAFHLDRPLDAADRTAGRTIGCPVLVHWGAEEGAMSDGPLPVWRRWADDVSGGPLTSGHFLPEEAPEELAASLRRFLG